MRLVTCLAIGVAMGMSAATAMADWSNFGKIREIRLSTGRVLIVHDQMPNQGCVRTDYWILPQTDPLFKETYATILGAHLSGQPLNLATSGCLQDFPIIVEVKSVSN